MWRILSVGDWLGAEVEAARPGAQGPWPNRSAQALVQEGFVFDDEIDGIPQAILALKQLIAHFLPFTDHLRTIAYRPSEKNHLPFRGVTSPGLTCASEAPG
ncbi:hypothetical protein KU43P_26580 [Pseudomonas sp. KU43P]|nr:hypothetical protein KU43P_26580 [Pseudomonas sp. KU43P]